MKPEVFRSFTTYIFFPGEKQCDYSDQAAWEDINTDLASVRNVLELREQHLREKAGTPLNRWRKGVSESQAKGGSGLDGRGLWESS